MNFEVGSTIGDYQVIGILGAGGMGAVYKVRNVISDRVEALKVLLPDLVTEPELADRFLREIKVQASLEHPNIAALHTAVRVDNQLLMLMECVEGVTLEHKLKEGPLPVAQAVDYIRQVLGALDYAHGRGVIHRDIKPANMMLTPAGMVKLMDFGIAKAATDRRLTMTGTTMGSLYYMSPEQIQGASGIDARADLYSLGVSLYELVTGKRPFDGDSQYAIMAAHLEKTPVPPVQLDPRLPQLLNDVILMSVLKDPNTRFQTAAAFRNALGNVIAGTPPVSSLSTRPVAAPAQPQVAAVASTPPRGKRGLWMAMGAVAVVLAVVGVLEFGPDKGAKAALGTSTASPGQNPPATVASPPVAADPQITPQQVPQQPAQQPSQQPAVAAGPSNPVPNEPHSNPEKQRASRLPQIDLQSPPQVSAPANNAAAPAQQTAQQPALQTPATPVPNQQAPVQAVKQAPGNSAAVHAELEEIRQQMSMLSVRANGVRGTLQRLETQQGAKGQGLNSMFTGPRDLMNGFLDEANNALAAGDPATAKSMMQKAEAQVERLEKLTGPR